MKVAVLSESAADEAAIRILVECLLGQLIETVDVPPLRSRGWGSVVKVLPTLIRHLHYRTDAEGLVVVVDSDLSPVHLPAHEELGVPECRLCILRQLAQTEERALRRVEGRSKLKVAAGLAVPQIEAWYLCGRDAKVTEAAWLLAMESGRLPYSSSDLKNELYGSDRPTIQVETIHAQQEARRLANDLSLLEAFFPNGFGP